MGIRIPPVQAQCLFLFLGAARAFAGALTKKHSDVISPLGAVLPDPRIQEFNLEIRGAVPCRRARGPATT